jgi:hypothetical protein
MEENETNNTLRCDECRGELPLGGDVISVQRAVHGPRGVIPLGEVLTFCSDKCVSRFFDHQSSDELPDVSWRIP